MARKTEMSGTTLPSTAAHPQSVPPPAPPRGMPRESALIDPENPEQPADGRRRLRDDTRLIPFLISMVVHTLLLIILALFSYRIVGQSGSGLVGRQGDASTTIHLERLDRNDKMQSDEASLAPQPVAIEIAPSTAQVSSPLRSRTNAVDAAPIDAATLRLGGDSSTSPLIRLPGGGLSGRTPTGRKELGEKYGASGPGERAVEEALRWMAEHQRPDGSWSFNLELDPCNGRCRHSKKSPDTPTPSTGATGLALLSFLGAGYTHHEGPYQETVRRGIYYLRENAFETEAGYDWQEGSMYGHGIALMALSEALAMTTDGDRRDSDLVDLVHRGSWFTVVAQHGNGSWGYVPGSPGDTTLTGWQVLSLLAAKRSNAPLGTLTLRGAKDFVMSTSQDREYSFGYQGPPGEPTTTAIGLTLMLYLGESPAYTPFYNALTEMSERGPTLTNVYHDYYATLALHHSRHPNWDRWNTKLRDFLVAQQATVGHEKGSWHFQDKWGDIGGRLYTTAMCTMMLEVYYRYLPLYAEIEDFPL